jgi:phosphoglycolate phosphatase-like HAD superfamily hydrolase
MVMVHLFLFDIDGVLVDAQAYQKALRDTVSHFSRRMGLGDHPPTDAEVRAFEANGLNSEWDSGAACVAALLLERLRREPSLPLPAHWPEALSALSTRPFPLSHPDYATLAKKVGQRLQERHTSPAQAAHAVLWDEAQAVTAPARSILAPLLETLLGHVHDFHRAPVTRHFQHLVIGSQAVAPTYDVSPDFESPAYLRRYDRPLLTAATRARLDGAARAALYTTRPSLPPAGEGSGAVKATTGYSPEAEMAQSLVGLDAWPLMGRGRLRWLARQTGEALAGLLKPFPFQALAAIGAAWSGQETAALRAALTLQREGRLCAPLSDMGPVTVHVFEDSPGGLEAVERGVEALRSAGATVAWRAYGIARAGSPKAATLAARGASIHSSVNEAVLAAIKRNLVFKKKPGFSHTEAL